MAIIQQAISFLKKPAVIVSILAAAIAGPAIGVLANDDGGSGSSVRDAVRPANNDDEDDVALEPSPEGPGGGDPQDPTATLEPTATDQPTPDPTADVDSPNTDDSPDSIDSPDSVDTPDTPDTPDSPDSPDTPDDDDEDNSGPGGEDH